MILTTPPPPPALSPPPSGIAPVPTWNDRVITCDGLHGRISFVWKPFSPLSTLHSPLFYRVSFPPRSPYFDDWAVYRQQEVTVLTPKL